MYDICLLFEAAPPSLPGLHQWSQELSHSLKLSQLHLNCSIWSQSCTLIIFNSWVFPGTFLIEIAAFSKCRICLQAHVSQTNSAFLKFSISQILLFSNPALLKSYNSQILHTQILFFSNPAILKFCNSQILHFSNSAIWGRHRQLDDSLVGQLIATTV